MLGLCNLRILGLCNLSELESYKGIHKSSFLPPAELPPLSAPISPHAGNTTGGGGGGGGEIETVDLVKPEMGGLGLLICEHDHLPGIYVKEVVQHKAAYLDKRVRAGDKILAINGQDTCSATQNYVVKLLQVSV